MVLMAGFDLPVRAIRQQVSSALDMIVHLERIEDGSRRVTAITEVQRMEADVITLQDIFKFQVDEVTPDGTIVGGLRSTGLRMASISKFERRGVTLPVGLFRERPYSRDGLVSTPGMLSARSQSASEDSHRAWSSALSQRVRRARLERRHPPTRYRMPGGERRFPSGHVRPLSPRDSASERRRPVTVDVDRERKPSRRRRRPLRRALEQSEVASGTVLAIDASNSMRGAPIESALEAARAFAAQRNVNQRLAILTFNSSTNVAARVHDVAGRDRRGAGADAATAVSRRICTTRSRRQSRWSAPRASARARSSSSRTAPTSAAASRSTRSSRAAKDAHVRVFTVGLPLEDLPPDSRCSSSPTATGGSFSSADSPQRSGAIYDQLGLQLAHEYLVDYNSIEQARTARSTSKVAVEGVGKTTAATWPPPSTSRTPSTTAPRSDEVWQSGWTMLLVGLLDPGAARGGDRRAAPPARQHRQGPRLRLRLDAEQQARTRRSSAASSPAPSARWRRRAGGSASRTRSSSPTSRFPPVQVVSERSS